MRPTFASIEHWLEQWLIGVLPTDVRRNLRIETAATVLYGAFYAIVILFLPVVLRRMGATSSMLALYTAQTYLGSIFAMVGALLLRRFHPIRLGVTFWMCGRGLWLLAIMVTQSKWLLIVSALFWLLEGMTAPASTQIIQAMYPVAHRGRVLSISRSGMVLAIILMTPLAGLGFDHWGPQAVFPIAGLLGILSALLYTRLRIEPHMLSQQTHHSWRGMWTLLKRNRRFSIFLWGFTIYGVGYLMGAPFFAIVQVDRLHLSYTEIGYLGLIQSLLWLFGNMYWGHQVDRRSGVWVLRMNVAIAFLVPFCYTWAFNFWTLLPAFIAQGIVSSGMDLGLVSAGIELAEPESVVEYSALQTTIIGIRGIIGSFIGVGLMYFGMSESIVFAVGCGLIALAWLSMRSSMFTGAREMLPKL